MDAPECVHCGRLIERDDQWWGGVRWRHVTEPYHVCIGVVTKCRACNEPIVAEEHVTTPRWPRKKPRSTWHWEHVEPAEDEHVCWGPSFYFIKPR
jgi:hypothetical protein